MFNPEIQQYMTTHFPDDSSWGNAWTRDFDDAEVFWSKEDLHQRFQDVIEDEDLEKLTLEIKTFLEFNED